MLNGNGKRAITYHQCLVSTEVGGAGRIALKLADFSKSRGESTRVWVPGPGRSEEEAKSRGLTTRLYDGPGVQSKGKAQAAWSNWKLARSLRREGIGIIHVHSSFMYGNIWRGLKFSGLKRIVHIHIDGGHHKFTTPRNHLCQIPSRSSPPSIARTIPRQTTNCRSSQLGGHPEVPSR